MEPSTAWITGASAGIGRAIAIDLAAHGWTVGLGSRRLDRLNDLVRSADSQGRMAAAELDVRDAGSVARWARSLRERIGEPAVVVNNAGWGVFDAADRISEEDWDRTIGTNLKGLFLVTRETLPGMIRRRRGHFVNILSVAARVPFPNNTAYNASKYGALGFTEALRAEARGVGIRVTAVLPGPTDTPFWERMPGEWDRSKMMPPAAVARAVREAIEASDSTLVEEIRLGPPLGNL